MEKQITIIIPTYNMEKYIGKCLDSLLIPELDEVEVLVVNDGSKDRSSEIAHSYADRYPQSIWVIDKSNGNYGSCINAALPLASGRYVKVLDSDDSFNSDSFSTFVKILRECSSDVILTDYDIVDENGNITKEFKPNILEVCVNWPFEKILKAINVFSQMHGITYRTEHLRNLNYHQTEGISYTDTEWTYAPLALAESFSYYNNVGAVYRYLVGRDGQTMDPSQFQKKLPEQFKVLLSRASTFEKYKDTVSNSQLDFLKQGFLNQSHYIYLRILGSKSASMKEVLCEFEKNLKVVSPVLYEEIGNLNYTPSTPYKMVKQFRKSQNPSTFKIPFVQVLRRKFNGTLTALPLKYINAKY